MGAKSLKWKCISQCGACCRLEPSERMDALEALNNDQRSRYLELVGKDGWCKFFDSGRKICTIYSDRPDFCKVASLIELFELKPERVDSFAIQCCKQQIRSTFGARSKQMKRFNREIQTNQISQIKND